MGIFYPGLKKYSNFLVPCPYNGIIGIYKAPAEVLRYPPMLPAGQYRMDARVYDGRSQVYFIVKTYGLVKPKGLHILKMK